MVRSVSVCLSALLLGLFAGSTLLLAEEQVLDGLAAEVQGKDSPKSEVITFSQVRDLVGAREKTLRDQYKGQELIEKIKELRLSAIQDLIDKQLIIQEFKKNKFTIPEYVVDDHIQTYIRQDFGGDRNAFIRTLEAQGLTMQRFKEIETDKIIVQAMRSKQVKSDIMIPPQQIEDYYRKHGSEFATPEQIHLRMIMVKKSGENGKEMAEEIRQKIVGGARFEDLAQMYSDGSNKESGGDWGWIDRKTLTEELANVAFKLKPGQVSSVVELSGSYYLLYVEAKKNASSKPLKELHDEIEKKLLQEERQKLQQKWLENLRKKAYIKMF